MEQVRVYEGLDQIGEVLGKSPRTIQRWINQHALPACKTPSGTWFISNGLIDSWILARHRVMMNDERKEQKPCVS